MIQGSIRIARLFGIDIRVHVSWLIIAVLFFSLTYEGFAQLPLIPVERAVLAFVTTALFFASVLLHELSHSIVARRFRLPVHSITLFLFGGVSNLRREPESALSEFLMAAVGPFTSFVLAATFWASGLVADARLVGIPGEAIPFTLDQLAFINLLLGAFNLLPGFPLDGGRVLRSVLWGARKDRRWATRVATRGGQFVAGLLVLWGIWQGFEAGNLFAGLWTAMIAFFLFNAASASYRQEQLDEALRRVTVGSLMTRDLAPVPPDLPVQGLVNMYVLPMRGRAFPVERDGLPVGVVSVHDVRRLPRAEWPQHRVAEIMSPLEGVLPLRPDDDAQRGLERMLRGEMPHLPVVEDGRLVGLFERDVVFEYLRMREELGLDDRKR